MKTVWIAVLLTLPLGCASEDVGDIMTSAERERFFAETESLEATMRRFVVRYHEARAKIEEYEALVNEAEDYRKEVLLDLRNQQAKNTQRAKETEALVAEHKKLVEQRDAQKTTNDAAQAEAKKLAGEAAAARKASGATQAALEKELEAEKAKAADLRHRIEVLRQINDEVSGELEALLKKMDG